MAVYNWFNPLTDDAFDLESVVPSVLTLSDESVSPLSGDIQTTSLPGSRWSWTLNVPTQTLEQRRRLWAYLVRLNGRQHRIGWYDLSRPDPVGTLPEAGVTVATSAGQFAQSITLDTGVAGCTIVRGDWVKFGTATTAQVVMAVTDATADGAGLLTFEFRNMLRAPVAAGVPCVLDRPRALYVLADPAVSAGVINGAQQCEPFTFEIVEVFR